jgi:hypothetical protein
MAEQPKAQGASPISLTGRRARVISMVHAAPAQFWCAEVLVGFSCGFNSPSASLCRRSFGARDRRLRESARQTPTRSADYIRASGHNGCIATEVILQAKVREMCCRQSRAMGRSMRGSSTIRVFPCRGGTRLVGRDRGDRGVLTPRGLTEISGARFQTPGTALWGPCRCAAAWTAWSRRRRSCGARHLQFRWISFTAQDRRTLVRDVVQTMCAAPESAAVPIREAQFRYQILHISMYRETISCRAPRHEPSPPLQRGLSHEGREPSPCEHGAPPSREVRPRDVWPPPHGGGRRG